jgi:hypothetical protein
MLLSLVPKQFLLNHIKDLPPIKMATKTEKIIIAALGAIAGGFIGNDYPEKHEIPEEDKWKYILGGAVAGGLAGYGLACLFGTPDDTINYTLVKSGKVVYHGITYSGRASSREKEHIRSGKSFHRMIVKPNCVPRCDAEDLERILIKRDKPFYNIRHNN